MKIVLTSLLFLNGITAFSVKAPYSQKASPIVAPTGAEPGVIGVDTHPLTLATKRIEGGKTIRTYHMPPDGDRCSYLVKTNGRPMRAKVEMWLGPIRRTHAMDINCQDGSQTPFRALLSFRKGPQVLKISTTAGAEYPVDAGVQAATPEQSKALLAETVKVWEASNPQIVQGGPPEGKPGAVRTFPVAADVKSVQVLFWSKDVGKRSVKAAIEVLQGPNNKKQVYDLHCSGGSQPYHCVFETPGEGWIVRLVNKNFLEFPFKAAVVPYEIEEPGVAGQEWWE